MSEPSKVPPEVAELFKKMERVNPGSPAYEALQEQLKTYYERKYGT